MLRDGFAFTVVGDNSEFADVGAEVLRSLLTGTDFNRNLNQAVEHMMAGMASLGTHPDVADGVRGLRQAEYRLITLSNGSTAVAEKLFEPAGIRDAFESLLSVENASGWKPAATAYRYAAETSNVELAHMMLVAVHPWDLHGAARAGLQTDCINRTGDSYPGYYSPPDCTASDLTELPSVLADRGVRA